MKKNLAVCSLLLLLSGFSCSKKGEQATGAVAETGSAEVLVSVNGAPALTLKDFQQFVAEATAADQQMSLMAQLMPDFEEKLFEGAKYREIIFSEWAKRNNVASREEYKKQKAQAEKAIESVLNQQMFIKDHVQPVTDSEVKKYYDDNKETDPNLAVNQEGVAAQAVSFKDEAKARDFAAKVREHKDDIVAAAKHIGSKVTELGLVTKASFIDGNVKTTVLAAKKFPSVLPIIKGEKDFWVVKVTKREPAKYRPFEQIKNPLKEHLMARKVEETVAKVLPDYEKKYGVAVNRSYFEHKRKEREDARAQQMKAIEEQNKTAKASTKELAQKRS